ncbi:MULTISPECIES: cytochrome c oxidase assembly protein [unclassified Marinovum]
MIRPPASIVPAHTGLAFLGLALLALLWVPWQMPMFPLHMLRHMTLVAIAAPLLVLGWPGLARLLAVSPLLATVLEFAVVWGWHLPRMYGLACGSGLVFALEQASFLLVGLLVWAGAFRAGQRLAGAGAMLLTSMHMTLLGALLILAPRDLFAGACGMAPDLGAQQLGGLLMLGIGTPAYLLAGVWLMKRGLAQPTTEAPT